MNILITGGAGYIGSITAQELYKKGYKVTIFDSLENGHKQAIKNLELVIGETQDVKFLVNTLRQKKIEAIIHFAAYIEMAESVKNPYKYYYNNVYGSLQLFKAAVQTNIKKIVFSSTAGVYGKPKQIPIKENSPCNPENPYGQSKLMAEKILKSFAKAHSLRYISLRYFNACGASLDGQIGEAHSPESHLIPNLIKVALGQKEEFTLFGNDYNTPDGTCIRDYIHVLDLADAHILALKALLEGESSHIYNLGTGIGYSNKQILKAIKKQTNKNFKVKVESRRPGDTDELIADNTKFKNKFHWQPKYSDLKTIIKTAFKWHQSYPQGYQNG